MGNPAEETCRHPNHLQCSKDRAISQTFLRHHSGDKRIDGRWNLDCGRLRPCDLWIFKRSARNWPLNGPMAAKVMCAWISCAKPAPAPVAKARWMSWATCTRGRTNRYVRNPFNCNALRMWGLTPSSRSGVMGMPREFFRSTCCERLRRRGNSSIFLVAYCVFRFFHATRNTYHAAQKNHRPYEKAVAGLAGAKITGYRKDKRLCHPLSWHGRACSNPAVDRCPKRQKPQVPSWGSWFSGTRFPWVGSPRREQSWG